MTGILATAGILLLMLALYAWSARAARRKGRSPTSDRLSLSIMIAAAVIATSAGQFFVWPELLQRLGAFSLDAQISDDPYFSALKQHYPDEYRQLTETIGRKSMAGGVDDSALVRLRDRMSAFVIDRLPHASDAAAKAFNEALVQQLRELRDHPVQCHAWLYPRSDKAEVVDFSPATTEVLHRAMAEVVVSSATGGHVPPTPYEALPAMRSVALSLQVKYGDDWTLLQETDGERSVAEKSKICVMTQDLYESILALPDGENGRVLRYMFSIT